LRWCVCVCVCGMSVISACVLPNKTLLETTNFRPSPRSFALVRVCMCMYARRMSVICVSVLPLPRSSSRGFVRENQNGWQMFNWNTLQHTAIHCNTLQQRRTPRNTLQHIAAYCSALQRTATHCSTLTNTLQHITMHCDTLQHTATRCNTLQHTTTQDAISFKSTATDKNRQVRYGSCRNTFVCICRCLLRKCGSHFGKRALLQIRKVVVRILNTFLGCWFLLPWYRVFCRNHKDVFQKKICQAKLSKGLGFGD